jgi:hypothetical protein
MKIYSCLMLCAVLCVAACKKESNDADSSPNNGGTSAITIDSPWQYSIKVDGTAYAKTDNGSTIAGVFSDGGQTAVPPDSSISNYGSTLYNPGSMEVYFEVIRNGHHFLGGSCTNSEFLSFFAPGNYSYTPENVNGITIHWYDGTGQQWGTELGTANQAGSLFTIVQVREETTFPDYDLKVLTHFNCKLYNSSGQSKVLTDGVYVSMFEAL